MELFNMKLPTQIISGKGCIIENADFFAKLGERALLITGKTSAEKSGALADVVEALIKHKIEYSIFNEIHENPQLADSVRAGKQARDMKADFIIAIGGGSVIDGAKAAAVFAIKDFVDNQDIFKTEITGALPLIAIGTTAGTGSELCSVSVLSEDVTGKKLVIGGDVLFPRYAFCDYRYCFTMSLQQTVTTGLDALCHCLESWLNTTATELTNTVAFRGFELLYPHLVDLAHGKFDPQDEVLRREQLHGSLYGGMGIALSHTCFPHPAGYVLTENAHIPHGVACAIFEPAFIRHSLNHVDVITEKKFFQVVGSLESFEETLGILTQNDLKISTEAANEIVERVSTSANIKRTLGNCQPEFIRKTTKELFMIENQKDKVTGTWTFGL